MRVNLCVYVLIRESYSLRVCGRRNGKKNQGESVVEKCVKNILLLPRRRAHAGPYLDSATDRRRDTNITVVVACSRAIIQAPIITAGC